MPQRDYSTALARVRPTVSRTSAMQHVCDLLWDAFSRHGISWVGFYLADGDEMMLECCRDKPACSPIGLHGACGRAYATRKPLIVRDVRNLGAGYIACDPRDQSELVIPLVDADGRCDGVLDVDSFEANAFDRHDLAGIAAILVRAQLLASVDSLTEPDVA